ncbi:hypothetical protein PsYK624_120370 [Phanerochaete sordida]|uniref:Uncharacterized protein n=1 Tax=Phanerochaete sordida TaxID=48140 RepID=A0A9P3LJ45_9APHY|nr:hypothetical protein PsYK624_120370 [Phanerochaete sordida]
MSATNVEDEYNAMAFCPNPPFPSADYSPTYQVCALGPPHMAPASRNRKSKTNSKHRTGERHGSTGGPMSTVEHETSPIAGSRGALWRTGYIMKHLERRAGPAAERIDHAPPPYIAPPELHAGTLPADSPTALPTPGTPAAVPVPGLGSAPSPTRGTNVGLVAGLLVGGAALLGVLAALGLIYWRRKAKNIRALSANVTPWKPHVSSAEVSSLSMSSSFGNFVLVSTTASEEEYLKLPSPDFKESFEDEEAKPVPRKPVKLSLSDPRRFSSPSLGATFMRAFHHSTAAGLTASVSAPPSPSLDTRDRSLHVQRQKAAELAQMVRMKFVKEELPVNGNSCPELASFAKRPALTAGLGIVHEQSEVDIANTLLCALDRYSVAFDAESPTVPITNLFQVDRHGKVVRRSAAPSPVSPASDASPRTPLQRNELSDNGSIATEDEDIDDVNDAVIVRLGQARSMEIKPERGMLVSLHTSSSLASPPPTSLSTSVLLPSAAPVGATIVRPKSTSAIPVPAPLLSPIATSPTSLSADIEETLEERVFAYRPSGPWSKANYQLTTPGQVRALTEALALAKPHTPHHQQQAWPWPAHRSAALDPEHGDD